MNKPSSSENDKYKADIPVVFSKVLATRFGPEAALVLQQTHYMTTRFSAKEENRINGHFWFRHAYADWHEDYPFWSAATFKTTIGKLEKAGILVGAQISNNKFDKGKWYRVDYDRLNEFFPSMDAKLFFDGSNSANRLDENHPSSDELAPYRLTDSPPSLAQDNQSAGTAATVEVTAAAPSMNKNLPIEKDSPDLASKTEALDSPKMDGDSAPTHHPAQVFLGEATKPPSGSGGDSSTSSEEVVSHDEAKEMAREIYNYGPLRGLVNFCLMPELSGVKPGPRDWKRLRKVLTELQTMTPTDVVLSSELFEVDFRLWWFMYGPGQDGEPIRVAEYILTVWPRFLAHHRKNRNWVMEFGIRHDGWLKFCKEDPKGFAELYAIKNRGKTYRPYAKNAEASVPETPAGPSEDEILEAMIREASV